MKKDDVIFYIKGLLLLASISCLIIGFVTWTINGNPNGIYPLLFTALAYPLQKLIDLIAQNGRND